MVCQRRFIEETYQSRQQIEIIIKQNVTNAELFDLRAFDICFTLH